MKLVPWRKDPREGRPLTALQREMNRLFDSFFGRELFVEPFHGMGDWSPALDVAETDTAIIVKAELPGMETDDVEISLAGDVLTIKGEKKDRKEEKTRNFHRVERTYGSFERTVRLPAEVRADAVEARYKNGVLTVELPKVAESKAKSVTIKLEE